MAMRSQVYEWATIGANQVGRSSGGAASGTVVQGTDYDIFIGSLGNIITMPASTTATQFVVIEDLAITPFSGGAAQVRINTTDYFQNPDVTDSVGIPGFASPYPRGSVNTAVAPATAALANDASALLPSFSLYPDVYVLPGQTWTVIYQARDTVAADFAAAVFVKYTLYDGPDALIANKLLEMGITVNPNNVDWYKRTLIEQQSAAASAAASAAQNGNGNGNGNGGVA